MFYFQLNDSSTKGQDKREVLTHVHSQDEQDDSQPTKPDMNKDNVRPVFSHDCEVSVDILPQFSDDYQIVHNVKYDNEQEEDSMCHREGDSWVSGMRCLQSVKIEQEEVQQSNDQDIIEPLKYSAHISTSINGVNKLEDVKHESKLDVGVRSRNSEDTIHWIVCSGNVLKEVKSEHAVSKSVTECGEDLYEKQRHRRIHNTNAEETETNVSIIKSSASGLSLSQSGQLETDDDANKLFCDTCGASITRSGSREEHTMSHRRVKTYTCNLCTELRASQCQRKLPEERLTCVKHFACSTCGKSFTQAIHLRDHERIHSGVKHFTCIFFEKSIALARSLSDHDRIHSRVKPHTCTICGKSFIRAIHLKSHEVMHASVKPFTCTICGKSFTQAGSLRRHDIIHSGVNPFTCTLCGKSFARAESLSDHELIHSGVKPFTCTICGKSFIRVRNLREHERLHSAVKPFTCAHCGKSFTHKGQLRYHEQIHSVVKQFTCTICGKSFARARSLTDHGRIHSGVKPCICSLCGKSFSLVGNQRRHEIICSRVSVQHEESH